MTVMKTDHARPLALPAAALAALLLAGCSSGHIGEDWQCPLAAGGSCASVAAADPAVPKTGAVQSRTPGQPIRLLPRERDADHPDRTDQAASLTAAPRSCEVECGFDPFAWLARLFGGGDDDARPGGGDAEPAMVDSAATLTSKPRSAASGAASLPADPATSGHDGRQSDDLRTGETVARIWIAPFVDAGGVYREASHVRVVLEPAGWRLR